MIIKFKNSSERKVLKFGILLYFTIQHKQKIFLYILYIKIMATIPPSSKSNVNSPNKPNPPSNILKTAASVNPPSVNSPSVNSPSVLPENIQKCLKSVNVKKNNLQNCCHLTFRDNKIQFTNDLVNLCQWSPKKGLLTDPFPDISCPVGTDKVWMNQGTTRLFECKSSTKFASTNETVKCNINNTMNDPSCIGWYKAGTLSPSVAPSM